MSMYMKVFKGTARCLILHTNSNLYSFIHCSVSVRNKSISLLWTSLLFLYACSAPLENDFVADVLSLADVEVKSGGSPGDSVLDVFIYDEHGGRLDCYQRIPMWDYGPVGVSSRSGDKVVALCADYRHEDYKWREIRSWELLESMEVNLEDELLDRPVMSGVMRLSAGEENMCNLTPLSAEVVLRSIGCRFRNAGYADEKLNDVKVYLTNVRAQTGILGEVPGLPVRFVNAGRLSEEDMSAFESPSLLVRELDGEVGAEPREVDFVFRSYPNTVEEEGPGTPFTRLVVEGRIGQNVWYWPLDVNRGEFQAEGTVAGVERNVRYVMDVFITRKGSSDPDVPVDVQSIGIELKVEKWKEKDGYSVSF